MTISRLGERSGAADLAREDVLDELFGLFRWRGSDITEKGGAERHVLPVSLLAATDLGVDAHHQPVGGKRPTRCRQATP